MTAQRWANVGGVGNRIKKRYVNDVGTQRRIKERWTNDGGTPRLIFADPDVTLVGGTYYSNTSFANAVFQLSASGAIFTTFGAGSGPTQTAWLSPKFGMTDYQCFASLVSQIGAGTFSGPFGSWIALGSSDRAWIANRPNSAGSGQDILIFDLSIRRASDLVVLASNQRITVISQG
jgi:hypothetical protein